MLPARYILIGADRWLGLLATSSRAQALQILDASPSYSDLTMSNYTEAYEWIRERGLLAQLDDSIPNSHRVFNAAVHAEIEAGVIPCTADDIPSPGFLPDPMLNAARSLGVSDADAWASVVSIGQKIDLERRSRVGSLGERALLDFLETIGCDVYHGSAVSDALGWDVRASCGDAVKHLEVKSTTTLARLRIYLSRHEYEVSCSDSRWALVVVLITNEGELMRVAHLRENHLPGVVPNDIGAHGRWQTCSIDLGSDDLIPGVPLPIDPRPNDGLVSTGDDPIWWPTAV
jgi:Holliday junction resolvase